MVKGEYVDAILRGEKTTTVRLGIVIPKYRTIIIHGGGKVIGKAIIEEVKHKRIRELTDADAKLDGFSSKEELLRELKKVYKDIAPSDYATIIKFRLIQLAKDTSEDHMYLGFDPVDIARIAMRYDLPLSEDEWKILELVSRRGSIRRAAQELGGLEKRRIIRRVLRKVTKLLVAKGVIKPERKEHQENVEKS
ncbi:MAG: ASCH domain-containing protein [Thermoprotei archaeon]|nr:MAG: ASCH domain-containing protein [Thermoprotei archaeon]RLF18853.1 MAG: ASCH domain-containing protein [Thermoprotei archaeon]